MFNNTTRVLPYVSTGGHITGVVLPHSERILSPHDVDEKIKRLKCHIAYLTSQLSHRNTHGGKRFRAQNVCLRDQISIASKRLELLQVAELTFKKVIAPLVEPATPRAPGARHDLRTRSPFEFPHSLFLGPSIHSLFQEIHFAFASGLYPESLAYLRLKAEDSEKS